MTDIIAICGGKGSGKSRASLSFEQNGFKRVSFATPLKQILSTAFYAHKAHFTNPMLKETSFNITPDYNKDELVKDLCKGILLKLGMTHFGAYTRMEEPSVRDMNIPSLNCSFGELEGLVEALVEKWDSQGSYQEPKTTARQIMQEFGTDLLRSLNEDIHVEWFRADNEHIKKFVCDDARFPNEIAHLKEREAETIWLFRPALGEKNDFHASETSIGQSDCDLMIKSEEGQLLDRAVNYRIQKNEWPKEVVL